MRFGAEQVPASDHFDEFFTDRREDQVRWREMLGAKIGAVVPILLYEAPAGAGKTYLRRRFSELCRIAGVPCLTHELDPNRQGEPLVDRAALAVRLVNAFDMIAPRTMYASLKLAMEETSTVLDRTDLTHELASQTVGAAADSFLASLSSFSVGGLVAALAKHGLKALNRAREPLVVYLKSSEGEEDARWFAEKPDIAAVRADMFRRFALDFRAFGLAERKDRAVKGVLMVDSTERAAGQDGNEEDRKAAMEWLYDLYASCFEDVEGQLAPRLLVAAFGQIHAKVPDDDLIPYTHRISLEGFGEDDARDYILNCRGIDEIRAEGILEDAREEYQAGSAPCFHAYSLGLACDAACEKGDLAEPESHHGASKTDALTSRFLRQIGDEDANGLRRLALTPIWDDSAAAYALGVHDDKDAAEAKVARLKRFSFVQPQGERWTLHSVMRKSLNESSSQENIRRWREDWLNYWADRAPDAETDFETRQAWRQLFELDSGGAFLRWTEELQNEKQHLRGPAQCWLVDLAWELISEGHSLDSFERALWLSGWGEEAADLLTGDANSYLERAISALQTALGTLTRESLPEEWAVAQWRLGIALTRQADRRNDAQLYEPAIDALKKSLEIRRREHDEDGWESSNLSLAIALQNLGELTEDAKIGEDVVAIYNMLADNLHGDSTLPGWVSVHTNLGSCLQFLGELANDIVLLRKAVEAHLTALEGCSKEERPRDWAIASTNLNSAKTAIYELGLELNPLEEAVGSYREVLEHIVFEETPELWTNIRFRFGLCLETSGALTRSPETVREATDTFREILSKFSDDLDPVDRLSFSDALFFTHMELLDHFTASLGHLSSIIDGPEPIFESVAVLRDILPKYSIEEAPDSFAFVQRMLGDSFFALANRDDSQELWLQAVGAYGEALKVWTPEASAEQWEPTIEFQRRAFASLAASAEDSDYRRQSIAAAKSLLRVRTREARPKEWGETKYFIGISLLLYGEAKGDPASLMESIATLKEAQLEWNGPPDDLGSVERALALAEEIGARMG